MRRELRVVGGRRADFLRAPDRDARGRVATLRDRRGILFFYLTGPDFKTARGGRGLVQSRSRIPPLLLPCVDSDDAVFVMGQGLR